MSALEQQAAETRFQQTAAWCAQRAGVKIIHKPGAKLEILGTTEQHFAFDQCMARRGTVVSNGSV